MLLEIAIADTASYNSIQQNLRPCKSVNYIYGANGSGKTTISRVIADPGKYTKSKLIWLAGRKIDVLVYNTDFTTKNFQSEMDGIFTLGEESVETVEKIKEHTKLRDHLIRDIQSRIGLLGSDGEVGSKINEARLLRAEFEETCWTIKLRHDEYFRDAFEGYRNSKSRICDKILDESNGSSEEVSNLADLQARSRTVFKKSLNLKSPLTVPSGEKIFALENAGIFAKKIVGREDIDIARLIKKLGNADWVKKGIQYLQDDADNCPFCQQTLPADLAHDLDEYFNEVYLEDIKNIAEMEENYKSELVNLINILRQNLELGGEHIDSVSFGAKLDELIKIGELAKAQIKGKSAEPSLVIKIESLQNVLLGLISAIVAANSAVEAHNKLVGNQAFEKTETTKEIWNFVVNESKISIDLFKKKKEILEKTIGGIRKSISQKQAQLELTNSELRKLEASVSSVQPTVSNINKILNSFGFKTFRLETTGEKKNFYKIVRADGSDAALTLSEGEKTFITFLYFYHKIKGNHNGSGATSDRVVVFDDPVSSLDANVLFIISSLIRKMVDEARKGSGQIKQIFILTHNVYFHKEITFDPHRGKSCGDHETFWVVLKQSDGSILKAFDYNPIRTSYELLWSEVRDPKMHSITLQNTLRRIVENYFKILGNLDKDEIIGKFEGSDQQICASLFSWVNDGSHAVYDDLYISSEDGAISKYLTIFKEIFIRTDHLKHYEMMIGHRADSLDQNRSD